MIGEIDVAGVFIPALLVWTLVALALNSLLGGLLRRLGFYKLVWHPPLFDMALFLMLLGGVVATANWISQ
jgi:hypothetical protein